MRVCPRCGRRVETVIDGLCPQCYAETRGIARLPDRYEVEVCRYCGSIRIGGRWVQVSSFQEAVETVVAYLLRRARKDPRFEDVGIARVRYETLPNWRTIVEAAIRGRAGGVEAVQRTRITVLLRASVCPVCKTRVSGEYDTVLQIRGLRRAGVESGELEERVIAEAERLGLQRSLVDVISHRDGVDVYFTDQGSARKLAKRLANIYGGRIGRARYESVTVSSTGLSRSRKTITLRLED